MIGFRGLCRLELTFSCFSIKATEDMVTFPAGLNGAVTSNPFH